MKKTKEFYRGCLIGGAVGDVLGWPVKFMKLEEIKDKYGINGVDNIILGRKGRGELSENTQLTLFTAEGLLRAESKGSNTGICDVVQCEYHAYLRWLYTQGAGVNKDIKKIYDGYLIKQKELYIKRLRSSSSLDMLINGKIEEPIEFNRDCNGVMRTTPVGLFYKPEYSISKAIDCVAITHGHPLAQVSAGALAYIISDILTGMDLETTIADTILELAKRDDSINVINLLEKAKGLAKSKKSSEMCIKELGEGLLPEEVLAIAVFCTLRYSMNFEKAVLVAINYDGDSSAIGSVVGSILGAYLGINKIPRRWSNKLQMVDVIGKIADDLLYGYKDESEWWTKYPAY